ncbi:hypothetical protein PUR71_08075 [Streptomyces sp. SP17BM10]|uniref:hypothetical protein n=1 Tax=Streptomyces sp. SP17BM10 TaxID=3002530 RepID=UPI002E79638D|nr:hypothetical protein [Streptomyces sp. SP17BM10]MEE1782872.1 hypothetical protein [Streptomyces sp. SP17BM10]
MAGTITLWVFGLLCFVVAFAREAASGAGISLPGPKTPGARFGVVAVGVLALILGTAVRPTSDDPKRLPLPISAATPSVSAPSVPSAAPAPATSVAAPPSPSATGPAQLWSVPVAITMDRGIDFDLDPPTSASGFPHGIYATGFTPTTAVLREEIQPDHDQFGLWDGQSAPTGAQCREWAMTHPGQSAHVSVGSLVCLRTPGGRTALIKIDSIAPADYALNATATVWKD